MTHRTLAVTSRNTQRTRFGESGQFRAVVGLNTSTSLKAANVRAPRKAVFCVSNVCSNFGCDDIQNYCLENGVTISKCFDVTPSNQNRSSKCFRVTVFVSDTGKFLDANFWPDRVTVRPWVFVHPVAGGVYTDGGSATQPESMDQ